MKNSETVLLNEPISFGEEKISLLPLRRPMSGDLRGIKLSQLHELDVNTILTLLPRICTVPLPPDFELDPADLIEVSATIAGFFLPKKPKISPSQMTH